MGMLKLLLLFSPLWSLFAIVNGNPGEPALLTNGIICHSPNWSFRIGYMGDYVYKEQFRDEFEINGCVSTTTFIKLYTNAGLLTFNLKKRLDVYGILGASRIQIDEEAFSKTRFGWGVGAKAVIYQTKHWIIGADLKYYESDQKPLYFICERSAYNIVSDYELKYYEAQGSLGVTYRTKYIAPYINASYISSRLSPDPAIAVVRLPSTDYLVDVISKSIINQERFGLTLGATLIDQKTMLLSVEWRLINQNSIDVLGEIRL